MRKIMLDTNIVVDYLTGREPGCSDCKELLLRHAYGEIAVYVAALSLKDAYYLVSMNLKRMERLTAGELGEGAARASNEIAWACIRMLVDNASIVPTGYPEVLQAFTYKELHSDFEDDLVVSSAQIAGMDYVVSNDAMLQRHAPIACLSSSDMVVLLNAERSKA